MAFITQAAMDKLKIIPACLWAIEHRHRLRQQILTIVPEAAVLALTIAQVGSRRKSGMVTREYHGLAKILNAHIPDLLKWSDGFEREMARAASAHGASVQGARDRAAKKRMPGLGTQIQSFARGIAREIGAKVEGQPSLPPEQVSARLAICAKCPHIIGDPDNGGRCAMCGCFVKAKATWTTQSCPAGKW